MAAKVEMIRSWEIKSLYAMAAVGGLVDKNSDEDELHLIVRRLTGKESIKKLTRSEYFRVHQEIDRIVNDKSDGGRIDEEQIKKAWALMYRIAELSPFDVSVGDRMCGAIKKICKVDAHPKDPFRFINSQNLWRLIEQLKRYVESLEKKSEKIGGEEDDAVG